MASTNFLFVSSRFLLMCTGLVSLAVILKLFVASNSEFSVPDVPAMWRSLSGWLKPPYLYVIINGIIITIAASSRFMHNHEEPTSPPKIVLIADELTVPPPAEMQQEPLAFHQDRVGDSRGIAASFRFHHNSNEPILSPMILPVADELTVPEDAQLEPAADYEDKMEDSRVLEERTVVEDEKISRSAVAEDNAIGVSMTSRFAPERMDSTEIPSDFFLPAEKPLVTSRFGHRKSMKSSPEVIGGRALRVSKSKKHDTLENTWKAITEGRAMPLARHLKKLDSWENQSRRVSVSSPDQTTTKKLETFKDRTNQQSPPSSSSSHMTLRKEPSLSTDELNRRVEAFIKKFNEEMRLQREQSLDQYKQMINRGS